VTDDEWDLEETAELDLLATDEFEQLSESAVTNPRSDLDDDDGDDAGFDPYNHA
jgi:hypothetical protein